MDLATLSLFVDVARLGGFSAAAKARSVDPSSVSRAIAGLEADIGFRLFQRTTRRLSLTEAGAHYLARIEPLLSELRQAQDAAASLTGAPRGVLRLTASVAFGVTCLTPLLSHFRAAFPEVRLELLLTDSVVDLVAERVDLAIRLGRAPSGDVVAAKWFETRYRVVASPDWVAAHGEPESPEVLSELDCLRFNLPDYKTEWRFADRSGVVRRVPVDGSITASNALAVRDACREGLGPALLADWLIGADIDQGRLTPLLPDWRASASEDATAAWFIYPSRAYLPAKVRAAIDFLRATRLPGGVDSSPV
ncbi:MAG: LysR family transcriptional regulator [Alphaproteobacteria bacterium]|nr:LysR family transcriptional regulator [Alphaproteobacteria bacterium]